MKYTLITLITLILTLLTLLTLAGCASAPVLAKDCVKAEGSNLFVCKKY